MLIGALLILALSSMAWTQPAPITFQRVGHLSPDVSEYLLLGRVETEPLVQELRKLQDVGHWVQEVIKGLPEEIRTERRLMSQQLKNIENEVTDLLAQAKQLDVLTAREVLRRQERALGVILGGLALLGTTLAGLAYAGHLGDRVERMDRGQEEMAHYVDLAADLAASNGRRINVLNQTLQQLARHELGFETKVTQTLKEMEATQRILLVLDTAQAAVASVAAGMTRLTSVWNQAIQGQVSIDLLPPRAAREALEEIARQLFGGRRTVIRQENIMDFYRLPCHLIQTNKGKAIAIPVPVYDESEVFEIYRRVPTPIAVDQRLELVVETEDFLVVNRERTLHAEISATNLLACLKIGSMHLCPHNRVFRGAMDPGCLFLLFQGEVKRASKECPLRFRSLGRLDITQADIDTYLITARKAAQVRQTCVNTRQDRTINVTTGTTRVQTPPGCSLAAENIYVVATGNQTIVGRAFMVHTGQQMTLDVHAIMTEAYPHLEVDPQELNNLTRMLVTEGAAVTPQELLAARAALRAAMVHPTSYVAMVTTLVTVTLVIVFFAWVVVRYRRQRRKPPVSANRPNRGRKRRRGLELYDKEEDQEMESEG